MTGSDASSPLRVFFFPMLCPGHMIPMIDIAKLFARHGAKVTVITTPGNASFVRPALDGAVDLVILPFQDAAGPLMPASGEHFGAIPVAQHVEFFTAVYAYGRGPVDEFIRRERPDCLVSDAIFFWTTATAGDLGISRLVFSGHGAFSNCVHRSIEFRQPHAAVSFDNERFAIEGLPHHIHLAKSEIPIIFSFPEVVQQHREAEDKSFGIIVNSFYELEPAYADLFSKHSTARPYYVGPVALGDREKQTLRGGHSRAELYSWLTWLDSKPAVSVVYVAFGTGYEFSNDQLKDLALGLETSAHPFVWVLRGGAGGPAESAAEWLPYGYESRVDGRGLIIRGWAPQVELLSHPAIGGFLTHCGWNSMLEGVTAGKPMATWPLSHEQFMNEKLLKEVAGIGVRVRQPDAVGAAAVTAEEVSTAVEELMGVGEAAEERRRRAREYAARAKAAMEEGGSSYKDMKQLVEDLLAYCRRKKDGFAAGGAE